MQVYLFCAVSRLWLHLPLPANPVGMILMLALIVCRILPLQWVRAGARWLLAEMLLFFCPCRGGCGELCTTITGGWLAYFAVIALSTVMVLGTTAGSGKVYRYEMRRLNRG